MRKKNQDLEAKATLEANNKDIQLKLETIKERMKYSNEL